MNIIDEKLINLEVESELKPLAIDSGFTTLPLNELSDRDFELLVYLLIKQEIVEKRFPNVSHICLMQGVGERGRDCVTYNEGQVSGLVQCKKYGSRITKPQVLKEVLKFLLFSVSDKDILPDKKKFEYRLYSSTDFTEPALTLLSSFATEIEEDIKSGKIKLYVEGLIEEYESFSAYKTKSPLSDIEELLRSISVSYCNGTELSSRIYRQDDLLKNFFNVKSVIDLQGADKVVRRALEDYGLNLVTDEDLKVLQKRIGLVNKDKRINLGYVDFFGYSSSFFKHLKGDKFKELLLSITNVTSTLNKLEIDFVQSEIHKNVRERITEDLLQKGKIHPFSVQVASPYLFEKLSLIIISSSMPKEILKKMYPAFSLTDDEIIKNIEKILIESSDRVMKGDLSALVGSPDDVQFKIRIYKQMHNGLRNIDDAKEVLKKDMIILKPILDQIEGLIKKELSEQKSIFIKDSQFFENKEELKKMSETLAKIE